MFRALIERIVRNTTTIEGVANGDLWFIDEEYDETPEEETARIGERQIQKVVDEYEKDLYQRRRLLFPFLSVVLVAYPWFSWSSYSSFLTLVGTAIIFYYAIKGAGTVLDQSVFRTGRDAFTEPQMKALVHRNVSQGYGALLTLSGLLLAFLIEVSG